MNYKTYNDYELIYMIRENDDFSQNVLFEKYQPIIRKIANDFYIKYKNTGYDYEDFLQEASIGFQKALFSFDDSKDNLFYSFAVLCIKRRLLSFCRMFLSDKYKYVFLDTISIDDVFCVDMKNNIDSIFDEKEIEKLLKTIIYDLSWEEGIVFELRLNGFQYLEISKLLDISCRKVGIILKSVRNIVRKRIHTYYCQ